MRKNNEKLSNKIAGSFNTNVNNLLKNHIFKKKNELIVGDKKKPTPKQENSNRSKRNRQRIQRIRKKKDETRKMKMERRLKREKLFKLAKGL